MQTIIWYYVDRGTIHFSVSSYPKNVLTRVVGFSCTQFFSIITKRTTRIKPLKIVFFLFFLGYYA
jgi:hypothetical protein